jgi:hypothetical protein
MESVFADGCDIKNELPTTAELRGAINLCEKARTSGNPNSITDFVCPQGNFFADNNQPINSDTLPYIIGVNLAFKKIDKNIKEYMLKLQKKRDADPTQWITEIRTCTDTIANIYSEICQFGTLESRINGDNPKEYIINKTNTYPQELCQNRARAKTQ